MTQRLQDPSSSATQDGNSVPSWNKLQAEDKLQDENGSSWSKGPSHQGRAGDVWFPELSKPIKSGVCFQPVKHPKG